MSYPTDITEWIVGPYHAGLPGLMRMKLSLDGDVIVLAKIETGYLHRGVEKAIEINGWNSALSYAERIDAENGFFCALALAQAVEEISEMEIPNRAKVIRVIMSELVRISGHLAYSIRVADSVGAETMMHYLLRDREKILDLFELVSGARYSHSYLRVGGVCLDVTDGFLERVLESGELIQIRLKEFNDLFTFNQTFQQRTCEIGGIDKEILIRNGSTGPNARAAGLEFDVRRAHPYASYEAYDFMASIPRESDEIWSDSHGRYLIRIKEISQSLDILKQAVHSIPSGPFLIKAASPTFIPKSGEAYSRVESIRGMLGCYVVSDGGAKPNRVQFRTPTGAHLACIPQALSGARIEDFPVILASMDIGMHEVDK